MLKTTLLFAIACIFVAVQAQTPRPNDICRTENEKCRRNERRLGRDNDVSNIFNNHCRQARGITNWRNVTRCELSLASCRLTLERCAPVNCENVRRSVGGGGSPPSPGGPPSPRTTTPRNPAPQTQTPSSGGTTARGGRTTRNPSNRRTTTRRTRTTRTPSSRRTTTRRTPTTRTPSSRRTTTRRTSRTPSPRTTTVRPSEE